MLTSEIEGEGRERRVDVIGRRERLPVSMRVMQAVAADGLNGMGVTLEGVVVHSQWLGGCRLAWWLPSCDKTFQSVGTSSCSVPTWPK
jgi:hypothetical protein